jgi:2'-5' RNA ligase
MTRLIPRILANFDRFTPSRLRRTPHNERNLERRIEIALVILVDNTTFNRTRLIQKVLWERLDTTIGLKVSPHISLKLGFFISASKIGVFEDYLDRLVSELQAFEIQLVGFGSFPGGILFLDVKSNPRLDELRRRILSDLLEQFGVLPNRFEGDHFHFHLTLASDLSIPGLALAQQTLEPFDFEHRFHLDTIALLIHLGECWTTYKQVRLSDHSQTSTHLG